MNQNKFSRKWSPSDYSHQGILPKLGLGRKVWYKNKN